MDSHDPRSIALDLAIELENCADFLDGRIADVQVELLIAAMRRKAERAREKLQEGQR